MEVPDHDCPLRPLVLELQQLVKRQSEALASYAGLQAKCEEVSAKSLEQSAQLEAALAHIEKLERALYGKKSEKMPPVVEALRAEESAEEQEARRQAALERRAERAALKRKLAPQTVTHHVPDEDKECPSCGGTADRPVGDGKKTELYEYIPGYFARQQHVQDKLACRCGGYIATAPPPPRVIEGGKYGPGFIAHIVVMKCADSLPLYRLAKQYERIGIPMSRSTLNDLFHLAARKLEALYKRLLWHIAQAELVQADETPIKMLEPERRGYVWAFIAERLIAYRFSASRSGQTPVDVLGGTTGTLVVDAYTGYNRVASVDGRKRAGCLAHVRRKFFDSLATAPEEARRALALILAVYRVEHEARARGVVRTTEHLALRQSAGRAAMDRFRSFLDEEQPRHAPKSPIGAAISYALNQWDTLTPFLDDVKIPLDNNASERALRVVALGRKNYLFVGDKEHGENLVGLYSLVSTCDANDVDPIAYLKDVLLRVDEHPASEIDDLLPHRWTPPVTCTIDG